MVAINHATVILPSDIAHKKYILLKSSLGHTFAPTIPIKNESVPNKEIIISPLVNIGKIPTIILDIIKVQVSKTAESIIIGSRNNINNQNYGTIQYLK